MSHLALVIPGLKRIAGAERQTILLAQGMRRRGWTVTVVALSLEGGDAAAELAEHDVGFLSLGMRKGLADPRGWMLFRRWLEGARPDVVHAHLPHAAWLVRWSRLATPVRVIIDTLHSSSTGTVGRRLGYRWSRWLPDQVTAVSAAVAQAHVAARMVDERRLAVLPNGVDTNVWRPEPCVRTARRRELNLDDEFLYLSAGRLDPVKNYPLLLRAFAQLPRQALLVIAGSGPMEKQLRALTNESGLDGRVRFLGFEPNILRWMQAADGFVLTSHYEGLPMCLLEAAACAVPSVATNVAGTNEVIDDGRTGLLAHAGDIDSLTMKMGHLMNMRWEDRNAMGTAARSLALARFSLNAVLERWQTLYHEALRRNPEARRWCKADAPC